MNKRLHVLLLFAWCILAASAQNISVASFRLLENDLTANTQGTMERDQNGEVAALIKIVTSEQGFTFDGGMVGITKVKQEVGEVWVYVPHGIKKITIRHQQLGVLRDYFFTLPIETARTYEMVLTTGRVETVVTHAVTKQFVVFNVTPADAIVELADEVLPIDGEGVAQKLMPYGSYTYRVSCPNYHTEAGIVTVTAEDKVEKNVTLLPNYGWIKVEGQSEYEGADVYIDNERVGKLPLTSKELKSGTHRVKVVKSMYKTFERQVEVSDNATTKLEVQLVANFAKVTLAAGEGCEIWIDGQLRGTGQWNGPLQIGDYTVEVKKASHRSASEIVRISSLEARTIQLNLPTPIYTSLVVSSTPARATVLIDGIEVGTTPLLKNDVLVGSHLIEFKKEGYGSVDKRVELQENKENEVSVKLNNMQQVGITTAPSKAEAYVDGVHKGVSSLSMENELAKESSSNQSYSSTEVVNHRPAANENYKRLALYIDGCGCGAWGSHRYLLDAGVGYGFYVYGLNFECEYTTSSQFSFAVKYGYGIKCGDHFMITPQIGFADMYFRKKVDDYYYLQGYYEDDYCTSTTIGCRTQYCLNRYFAVFVTPEIGFSADKPKCSFRLKTGLTLNLGKKNK